jgi:hypothetical protein
LFMPEAKHLSDPLEGTAPGGEARWWAVKYKDANCRQRRVLKRNRQRLNGFRKMYRQHYFVSCWHMNLTETEKMWILYTKSTDAVAIRTTYSHLRRVLPDYVFIGVVRYIDYSSDTAIAPIKNVYEDIMHKNLPYEFESEVRAVACSLSRDTQATMDFANHLFEREGDHDFKVFAPPINVVKLIDEVIIANQSGPKCRAKVKSICSNKGLPKPRVSTLSVRRGLSEINGKLFL